MSNREEIFDLYAENLDQLRKLRKKVDEALTTHRNEYSRDGILHLQQSIVFLSGAIESLIDSGLGEFGE